MKKITWLGLVLLAVFLAASCGWAEEPAGGLIQFKTGEVSFALLQSDGVTPLAGAELQLLSPADAGVQVEAVADRLGKAVVTVAEGRYLLSVSGQTLSVLDVADDATLSVCRVVVPDSALLVAGQEDEGEDEKQVVVVPWLKPVVIGGVAVLVAAGGGYAIYDHNDDDDDKGDTTVPSGTEDVTPAPTRTRPRPSLL